MDEVVVFIRKYAKTYWALYRANWFEELTDAEFEKRRSKIEKEFIGYSGGLELSRTDEEDRKEYQAQKSEYANRSEPIPLLVLEYTSGRTKVWRCFVSVERSPNRYLGFGAVYDVQARKGLKITAESRFCSECRGARKIRGRKCAECGGQGILTFHGTTPDLSGATVSEKKLKRPELPADAELYDKLSSLK